MDCKEENLDIKVEMDPFFEMSEPASSRQVL